MYTWIMGWDGMGMGMELRIRICGVSVYDVCLYGCLHGRIGENR